MFNNDIKVSAFTLEADKSIFHSVTKKVTTSISLGHQFLLLLRILPATHI